MKRFSPIFFIWLFNFIFSTTLLFTNLQSGTQSEIFAWSLSTLFTANILLYHLYITSGEKNEKN